MRDKLLFVATCLFSAYVVITVNGAGVGFWVGAAWCWALLRLSEYRIDHGGREQTALDELVDSLSASDAATHQIRRSERTDSQARLDHKRPTLPEKKRQIRKT